MAGYAAALSGAHAATRTLRLPPRCVPSLIPACSVCLQRLGLLARCYCRLQPLSFLVPGNRWLPPQPPLQCCCCPPLAPPQPASATISATMAMRRGVRPRPAPCCVSRCAAAAPPAFHPRLLPPPPPSNRPWLGPAPQPAGSIHVHVHSAAYCRAWCRPPFPRPLFCSACIHNARARPPPPPSFPPQPRMHP
jgi:hypothetical protein